MVSARKFFSITVMMMVLLFMFQFSGVMKEQKNEYDVNGFSRETGLTSTDAWQINETSRTDGEHVAFVGKQKSDMEYQVKLWCTYTKRSLNTYESFDAYEEAEAGIPQVIVLDADAINCDKDTEKLKGLAGRGVSLIFSHLPDTSQISENQGLQELLGIQQIQEDSVSLSGIKIFDGFLLGGESIYQVKDEKEKERQDFTLTAPWYYLSSGTKTYMVGLFEDEKVGNEYLPALIWRNRVENAYVFAVNGDYMTDITAVGIYEAMMYEQNSYDIYPVVNAQNLVVSGYPLLSSENEEEIMELYSRTPEDVFQDIVWSAMTAVNARTGYRMTFMLAPQMDYQSQTDNEYRKSQLVMYLKSIKELGAEAGLAMEHTEDIALEEKIEEDKKFWAEAGSKYEYRAVSAQSGDLEQLLSAKETELFGNLRTVVGNYEKNISPVSFCGENVTLQCFDSDGISHTYKEDFRLKSLETALGYSTICLDMSRVAWPSGSADRFENYYKAFSDNISSYWTAYKAFDKTTLSESDARVRTFLAVDYEAHREENCIVLKTTVPDSWFLLRTKEAVKEIEGGTYKTVEDNVYLIHAGSGDVKITLHEKKELQFR